MENLKVIETDDGSSTIYHKTLRETYHSTHGALTESRYVFIRNGLDCWIQFNPGTENNKINVLEIGFGTGLNAVLSYEWSSLNNRKLYYESIEAYPLPQSIIDKLNYFDENETLKNILIDLHKIKWDAIEKIGDTFEIKKVHQKLERYFPHAEKFDVVFYDAFAPSKQEEMWSFKHLQKVLFALKPGGILVTYCAKGQLKRDLKELGCEVETLPGPPGKKEMVRATKIHKP